MILSRSLNFHDGNDGTHFEESNRKISDSPDEIGRGTSTFDGLSIAWSVTEDICRRIGARTLFATHYHQLMA